MAENTKKQDLATGAELTLEEKINKIKSVFLLTHIKHPLKYSDIHYAAHSLYGIFFIISHLFHFFKYIAHII